MKKYQVVLLSGTTQLTCWVDEKVEVGNRITLKDSDDPDRLWTVLYLGAVQDSSKINRGWGQTDVPRGSFERRVGME